MGAEPNITKIIEPDGEVSDEIDYLANSRLAAERGFGFTACQPSLVEIEIEGKSIQAIKMGIDHTYVDSKTGQVMGYGIIGHIYVSMDSDPQNFRVFYITPKEELEEKIQYIFENNVEATPRPNDKY